MFNKIDINVLEFEPQNIAYPRDVIRNGQARENRPDLRPTGEYLN